VPAASMVGRLSCCSTSEMVSMASTVQPLSNEAEDVVVSKELRRDQNQGHNCESDLDLFSPKATVWNGPLSPLRGRSSAERANPPNHVQIGERSDDRENHHRSADGVLVKSRCWRSGSCSDCSKSA
jgi:hypothetical protein